MNRLARHKPKQLMAASTTIGNNLRAIQNGYRSGKYPALERAFDSQPPRQPVRIVDVWPGVPERLAVVEHTTKELDRRFEDHKNESIRAGANYATKEEVQAVDGRIDRDIWPAIKELRTNNTFKLTLVTIGLMVSIGVNVIAAYRYFNP